MNLDVSDQVSTAVTVFPRPAVFLTPTLALPAALGRPSSLPGTVLCEIEPGSSNAPEGARTKRQTIEGNPGAERPVFESHTLSTRPKQATNCMACPSGAQHRLGPSWVCGLGPA